MTYLLRRGRICLPAAEFFMIEAERMIYERYGYFKTAGVASRWQCQGFGGRGYVDGFDFSVCRYQPLCADFEYYCAVSLSGTTGLVGVAAWPKIRLFECGQHLFA